jgi:peptidoglycan/LPS O-acetylase OafA/YrhL
MPALTGIRFPLALWVVSHHLSGPGRPLEPVARAVPAMMPLIDAASVALGTFFAISGFVLALRYRQTCWNRTSVVRYGIARVGRVYPVYLLSLLIVAPIIRTSLGNPDLGSPGERASLLASYVLLLQGWERLPVNWNTPAWSLSCEVFFYACFPAIALLVRRVSAPRVLLTLGAALALPIALRASGLPLSLKPLIYFGDFLAGVGAAGLYEWLRHRGLGLEGRGGWLYVPAVITVVGLLLLAPALAGSFYAFDTGLRAANVLLIVGLAWGGGLVWRALSAPIILVGGQASYAIYILHIPVLWWYQRSETYHALPSVAAGLLYLAIVIGLSVAVSRWYEMPANTVVRRYLARLTGPRATERPGARTGLLVRAD